MDNKIVKCVIFIIGVLVVVEFFLLGFSLFKKDNEEKIEGLEKIKSATLVINSDITATRKYIDILDEDDVTELIEILENVTVSKYYSISHQSNYYISSVSFYDDLNNKITDISLDNLEVTTAGRILNIKETDAKKIKEIINKYIDKNEYGTVTCQNGIETDIYYVYDKNIVKYVHEIRDLTEKADFDRLRGQVDNSENVDNYSAFLLYDNKTYGNFPEETLSSKKGYYYYSDTYQVDKMNDEDIKRLLNMSKSGFENITVDSIIGSYPEETCRYSIW